MKKIFPLLIFVLFFISNLSICLSNEDLILYELKNGENIFDISYDPKIDSFYIVGTIRDTNNSFIIKSKNGQVLRKEIIEDVKVSGVMNDKFSNVYLVGNSKDRGIMVIKLTSSLNKRWETKIRLSERDILSSFCINDNQEVTVLGYSPNKRESDTFFIRIDRNGKIIDKKIVDVAPFERPYKILEDKDNNFYVTGEIRDKNLDIFLLKLSKDYDILWIDFYDNHNWEDGGLDLDLLGEDVIVAGYSGKEGWYVFDTVFITYSNEGNISKFSRKGYSGGSDWIRQFMKKGEYSYVILWDILTGKEFSVKLDNHYNIITINEIPKEEYPIKIIDVLGDPYLLTEKDYTLYIRNLE